MESVESESKSAGAEAVRPMKDLSVNVVSSKDGALQKAICFVPPEAGKGQPGESVPLLVFLHTWNGTY
ncbi:MAG: hypothetical protein WCS52_17545 [bacterium]